ncbi:MAG TPA: T9SS type A sorting domain-containing protein, partial [Bacteroidia bacterium]|nr:T9SS type A sorting domain-containing protein [Bacteroidia bacterium]
DNSSISAAIQPDVIFEPGVQKYAVSYYDSTASALLLFSTGYNVNASSSWTIVSAQYNDATNNLKAAHPQIAWNPNTTSAVCAWNAEGVSTNGVSMFDAEVVSTNVDQLIAAADFVSPYPNPSSGITTFEFNLKEQRDVQLHVTNMMGQEVMAPVDMGSLLPGNYTLPVDFSALSNGTYIYTMQVGNEQTSGRIVVAHR